MLIDGTKGLGISCGSGHGSSCAVAQAASAAVVGERVWCVCPFVLRCESE